MKNLKKIVSIFLVALMLLTSVPLGDVTGIDIADLFTSTANAAGISQYSPLAAVEWAKAHWNDTTSVLLGKGYWAKGTGDCANFVSQCIYMGGIDMTKAWHTNGYNAHFSETNSNGSFIRAQQLYNYVCSIGGTSIKNPSASQVEIGDLIFYWKPGGSRINHSAIVIDIIDGVPQIAYHSDSDSSNNPIKVVTTEWHCGRSGDNTYLVKMNGAPCISPNPRELDVYTVSSSKTYLYKTASTSSTKLSTYKTGEYTHIYEEKTVNGVEWGYTQRYGVWGWVKISQLNYHTSVSSGITNHLMGEWYTTKQATCAGNGEQRRDCARCDYYETRTISGGHSSTKAPTCYEASYCDICGTLISEATGHNWDNGTVTVSPTCVTEGKKVYTCKNDSSHTYTQTIAVDKSKHTGNVTVKNKKDATCVENGYTGDRYCADCGTLLESGSSINALGHDYVSTITSPTCTENGLVTKKCSRCDAKRTEYANGNNTWSDWTTEVVSGIPSNKIQTKTQYRYSDKQTTSSYSTSLSGWTQSGSEWVQSGSGTIDYCSFPSGFSSSHSLYSQYNNSPVSAYENETSMTTVSTSTIGYIFWHWCRGESYSNINRKVSDSNSGQYSAFHAFFTSDALGTYSSSARTFNLGKGKSYGGCKDTYWWIGVAQGSSERLAVYRCFYTNYNKLFYYYKWSGWSDWQDSAVWASDTRQVETRTLYKYDLAALGHDFSVDGGYKAPTCTEPGYSGKVCSRCGTISSDTTIIPALGHVLYDTPSYDSTKEQLAAAGQSTPLGYWYRISADGVVPRVYQRDCARCCGYSEQKTEGCIYVLTSEVKATCLEKGKKIYTCTLHGETKEEATDATGHNWGDTTVIKNPTCEQTGVAQKVCKNDASHIETSSIPALGHTLKVVDGVEPKCETNGNIKYYVCTECEKLFSDEKAQNEIELEDTLIPALGHSGLDENGNEVWETVTAPGCGVTGYERMLCQREFDGEKCLHLIDEREVPGYTPVYKEIGRTESTCCEPGEIEYTCTVCEGTENEHGYFEEIAMKEHPWGDDITESPNCTDYGRIYHVCTYCSEEELIEELEPLGHDKGSTHTVYATCTEDGYSEWKCQRTGCGYTEVTETYPATKHNFSTENHSSSCVSGGYTVYTCTNTDKNTGKACGYTYTDSQSEALGHDLGEWYTVTKATCTTNGLERSDCSRCDYYITRITNATNHDMKTTVVNASCTEDGYKKSECQNDDCDYSETEILKATGHDYKETERYPATCTQVETVYMVCVNDSSHTYFKLVDTEPLGHNFTEKITDEEHLVKAATCTSPAVYRYDCARTGSEADNGVACGEIGKKTYEYGKALGHESDGNWVVTTVPTCIKKGEEQSKCVRHDNGVTCDKIFTREIGIDSKNHDGETYTKDQKDPTCLDDGYTGDTYCSDCNGLIQKGDVIPATGHDWGEWEENGDGTHTRVCENDSTHTETQDCSFGDWTVTTPETCTKSGEKERTCTVCGYVETETIPAKNHKWGEWTENGDGTHTRVCENDSTHTETQDCSFGEWTVTIPATCTEDGEKERICTVCEYVETETIPAIGHDWGEWEVVTEPDYDNAGEKKRICNNDSSHVETADIPVLTRPSDVNDNVDVDKTVDYDSLTGEAQIKLYAASQGEKVTVKSRTPLDIVLVLDQSGSMANNGLSEKLKKAATTFTNALYEDGKESGADHRISIVGFAMQLQGSFSNEYYDYLNTEVLTTGGEPVRYNSLSKDEMKEVYKNSLVSIGTDSINPVITTAIDNLDAKGATAADLGLDMACQIFAQNPTDGQRKRIVVFMTDGVPTYGSDYMATTAQNASEQAELLKNTYGADLYAVGVLSGDSASIGKTFLNLVASTDSDGNKLYFDCSDAEALVSSFEKIAEESTYVKTTFDDITLVDTVSSAFTLTSKQENELRAAAVNELGVNPEDVTVTRFSDGTTEVKIKHITPVREDEGEDVKFVVRFSFNVTANENALTADSYLTNTDNAGVILGTKDVYENNFVSPSARVDEVKGVIYFNINGKTYHVLRVTAGETPTQPEIAVEGEYTFSGWDIPEEITFEGGRLTLDATLELHEYAVTWNTSEGSVTDYYHYGEFITVPEVGKDADGNVFDGWDKTVPTTMPAQDITFTAVYAQHEHSYEEKITVEATCTSDGEKMMICSCGEYYTETILATGHKWQTNATVSYGYNPAHSHVYCANCGTSPDSTLSYTVTAQSGNREVTYDLKLVNAQKISIDVDGNITVSLPIPQELQRAKTVKIYRQEADGTLTDLNGTVSGRYITFTTDHFSTYIMQAIYECDETGIHKDLNCDEICDMCDAEFEGHELGEFYEVIAPTCTQRGAESADCVNCTYSYTRYIPATGHNFENGTCTECGKVDGVENTCPHICHKSGLPKLIWKIILFFCKLLGVSTTCSCGAAHY